MSLTDKNVASALKVLNPHFAKRDRAIIAHWTNKDDPKTGSTVLIGDANAVMYSLSQFCRYVNDFITGEEDSWYDVSAIDGVLSNLVESAEHIYKHKDDVLRRMFETEELIKYQKPAMYTQPMNTEMALDYIQDALKPEDPDDVLIMDVYDGETAFGGAIVPDDIGLEVPDIVDALRWFCICYICKFSFASESEVIFFCSRLRSMLYPDCDNDDEGSYDDPLENLLQQGEKYVPQFTIDDLRKMGFTDDEIRNSPNVPLHITDENLKKIGMTPEQFKEMFAGLPGNQNNHNTKPQ